MISVGQCSDLTFSLNVALTVDNIKHPLPSSFKWTQVYMALVMYYHSLLYLSPSFDTIKRLILCEQFSSTCLPLNKYKKPDFFLLLCVMLIHWCMHTFSQEWWKIKKKNIFNLQYKMNCNKTLQQGNTRK